MTISWRIRALVLAGVSIAAAVGCGDMAGPWSRGVRASSISRSSIALLGASDAEGGAIFAITGVVVDTIVGSGVTVARTERRDSTLVLFVGPLGPGPIAEIRLHAEEPSKMRLSLVEVAALNTAGDIPRTVRAATLRASPVSGQR